ncbi:MULTISPECIES: transglycosylase domain-containing protein [unclassified Kitasatospora]|uniref:transglycosylase domain-containing protein n=1 Tax=unclassified Kitasatospora TaxID=2633591 RepID=UPI00070F9BD0|nr:MULTISPECIES: transglycosylase domain-containing protein [unclassified Kitasatospora]KQV18862.1 penicillin-binding protein [Kitasatospora sp. Root107]KRB74841.1 penicillin-binding protein [Kitasatospora sp. Root187]
MAPQRPAGSPLDKAGLGLKFLGISVLAGVLVAGMALPAIGALGLTAKDTAESFDNVPTDFKAPTLSQASFIYDAQGGLIAKVFDRDRTILTQEQMGPIMRQAQVDIEDARFYEHGAIDLKGVLRAIGKNAESGEATQGASTLTQQYVKNVNVELAGDDKEAFREATKKSLGRKIQELKIAIKLEEELTKDQILTNYLNITFYGHQAYGIESAANRYFSKSAKDLSIAEAATLAGLVQNPTSYDPLLHPQATQTRRNTVISKLLENKHITEAQAKEATAAPLNLKYKEPLNGCITAQAGMGFFCDYVRHVVKQDPAFGKSTADRQRLWSQGGLKIYTTIDPEKQAAANKAVTTKVYANDSVAAAATMIKPGTGEILAMSQSRPYGLDTKQYQMVLNLNVDKAMGGGNGFSPGSTFKPIVAAAALEAGTPLTQEYPSEYKIPYPTMSTCTGTEKNIKGETVANESKSEVGPYQLKEAMAKSVNTYFVQMEQAIGLCPVKQMANKLGIKNLASGEPLLEVASMVLGTQEVSPMTMANVYATFAARGKYCSPIAVKSVVNSAGTQLPVPQANCTQVMSETTADGINSLLLGVTEKGTGSSLQLSDGRQIAGKTGTTDFRNAAWFTGYTPELATSVWLGGPTVNTSMKDIRIGGKYFESVYGATGPGPIWQMAMQGALAGAPKGTFQTVNIPDPQPKPDPNASASPPSGDGAAANGGLIGGNFTLPPGIIGGNNGGGNGNGGGRH